MKPAPASLLISWDDAETYFHEFGHALHSLSSNVAYPTLNGGVRDYTEFQSQLLERWLSTDAVINTYLVHYETGKPMPAELIAKIKAADTFNEGFRTTEYLASALVDMRFHTADPTGIDPDRFERETLAALGMPGEIVMRHRSPHFSHIFSGEDTLQATTATSGPTSSPLTRRRPSPRRQGASMTRRWRKSWRLTSSRLGTQLILPRPTGLSGAAMLALRP